MKKTSILQYAPRVAKQSAAGHSPSRSALWRARRKGQALVEMALLGLVLLGLLAGAVDLGRLVFTAAIVENMAGEGAAFAALYPDQDGDAGDYQQRGCSLLPVDKAFSIQERVRRVAREHGLIVAQGDQDAARIGIYANGDPAQTDCHLRAAGIPVSVSVTYEVRDLFLPGIFGFGNIPITKHATQFVTRNVQVP